MVSSLHYALDRYGQKNSGKSQTYEKVIIFDFLNCFKILIRFFLINMIYNQRSFRIKLFDNKYYVLMCYDLL